MGTREADEEDGKWEDANVRQTWKSITSCAARCFIKSAFSRPLFVFALNKWQAGPSGAGVSSLSRWWLTEHLITTNRPKYAVQGGVLPERPGKGYSLNKRCPEGSE